MTETETATETEDGDRMMVRQPALASMSPCNDHQGYCDLTVPVPAGGLTVPICSARRTRAQKDPTGTAPAAARVTARRIGRLTAGDRRQHRGGTGAAAALVAAVRRATGRRASRSPRRTCR